MNGYDFYGPTRVVFGEGCVSSLCECGIPGGRPLVVTSSGRSAKMSGALDAVLAELDKLGAMYELYAQIPAESTDVIIEAGAVVARAHKADCIIAIGGGSVLDSGKLIALLSTNEGSLADYAFADDGSCAEPQVDPLPLVCVPTTAGTGSDQDPWSGCIEQRTGLKLSFGGYSGSFPAMTVVDPSFTLGLPPHLTAYQGFDVLFHAVECYISVAASPLSDMYARTIMETAFKCLPLAVSDGRSIDARSAMSFAASTAGALMAFCPVSAQHAIENGLSSLYPNIAHGEGLILICEAFFGLLAEKHWCDERLVDVARVLGAEEPATPSDVARMLGELRRACGVADQRLADSDVAEESFVKIAAIARQTMGDLIDATPGDWSDEDTVEVLRRSL